MTSQLGLGNAPFIMLTLSSTTQITGGKKQSDEGVFYCSSTFALYGFYCIACSISVCEKYDNARL